MVLIYSDLRTWGGHENVMDNVKVAVFAHFKFIEIMYPTVAFCVPFGEELRDYFSEIDVMFSTGVRDVLVTMNAFKNMGTLLQRLANIDECFYYWDGKCAGEHMGEMMISLLDPAIEADYEELTG